MPEEIDQWWTKYPRAMIGIITGKISGLVVVDIDVPTQAEPELRRLIPHLDQCPTVNTPRGGKHLYFLYPGRISNRRGAIPGSDFRGDGGYVVAPPSCNSEGREYTWAQGQGIFDIEPPQLSAAYIDKINEATQRRSPEPGSTLFTHGRRDDDLFMVANALLRGGMAEEMARSVIAALSNQCIPPFPPQEANIKVDSAIKRALRRERNMTADVRAWVSGVDGHFDVNDFYRDAGILNPDEKKSAIMVFLRLVEDGIIEKYGTRKGVYRPIQDSAPIIDFINASDEIFRIRWPLGIEELVEVLPKNIVIVAGEKDSGKTAYLLNVVRLNMKQMPIHYFSSEMDAIEMKKRLSRFNDMSLSDWKFYPRTRLHQFGDVIEPDAVNIVDFLEIYDEFYKIGLYIRQIYDKLQKGIAILALQKNPKTDLGLGGARSLEKARLYLSIEHHRIKIISGKNWATEYNPTGLYKEFRLVGGCNFIQDSDWRKD